MNGRYNQEDFLSLSGIQHFAFCRRQWALIHIEQQWNENLRTLEGSEMHERADDPHFFESRGSILTARSVPLASYSLGFYGISDIVEFHTVDKKNGAALHGRDGYYRPVPVEYKHGKPKENDIDAVQLCAQAMCLEEMLLTAVPCGYLYYGETKHRVKVEFDEILRTRVTTLSAEMHRLYESRVTPRAVPTKSCNACSLKEICVPRLAKRVPIVSEYIKSHLQEDASK